MPLNRFYRFDEVHDFDAFYITMILLWKHMRYPAEMSGPCMEYVNI